MKVLVEKELDCLEGEGIFELVASSEWAALIVPVLTSDKNLVQILGDFNFTVNKAPKLDRYLIPKVEDLLASLMVWWSGLHKA